MGPTYNSSQPWLIPTLQQLLSLKSLTARTTRPSSLSSMKLLRREDKDVFTMALPLLAIKSCAGRATKMQRLSSSMLKREKNLCSGPPPELAKIKPLMDDRMPVWYVDLDGGAMQLNPFPSGGTDSHVSVLAEFAVPSGKMADASALFPKAYATTKAGAGASGCLYYGFGKTAESIYVREGYKNAAAGLAHGADVKEMAEDIAKKAAGVKINVVGPKSEIDQLRPKLEPRGAIFWELDAAAFWK